MRSHDQPDEPEVPDGAAVFPEIPEDLGVDPLLLAVVHATIFVAGSDESIVDPEAADESVAQIAAYLQRLEGQRLLRVREDMACLVTYARQQKWPKGFVQALRTFLADMGVQSEAE